MKVITFIAWSGVMFIAGRLTTEWNVSLTPKAKDEISRSAENAVDRIRDETKEATKNLFSDLQKEIPESPIQMTPKSDTGQGN